METAIDTEVPSEEFIESPEDLTPEQKLLKAYGAHYWTPGEPAIYSAPWNDLYHYDAYYGSHHDIEIERGDSLLLIGSNGVRWTQEANRYDSNQLAVMLRGYKSGERFCEVFMRSNLPYVNGCSTRQLLHPERDGDPTVQQLTMPPFTTEQVHHIHATARVVYVAKGRGYSLVGTEGKIIETELTEGMLCILDPMCPHHFRTEDEWLTVLPVHIFSSTVLEGGHPMMYGTKEA